MDTFTLNLAKRALPALHPSVAPSNLHQPHPVFGMPFAVGNTATLYHYDNMAVKLFNPLSSKDEAMREYHKHAFAYSLKVPTPKVDRVEIIDHQQALIMDYVEGQPLGEKNVHSPEALIGVLATAIQLQQHLHQIQIKEVNQMEQLRTKIEKQIQSVEELSIQKRSELTLRLEDFSKTSPCLCHGDFHFLNILSTKAGHVIIDWVDASIGDPLADVCRSYLLYINHSQALGELYLHLYCAATGVSEDAILKWLPILACARLAEKFPSDDRARLFQMIDTDLAH
ncbi:phosphotransferase family protein [Bacillus sp. Marseille-P3800]|uniref:phosphotransferase family protein n=1 Tax=Bacillus sp. Marseille-P3800 TaxID=2014782 RepID=UPI000C0835FB|nr:aminoglycoside phosphotransferase family protein [Bacillus sp. Marseille-P3800]